MPGYAKFMKNIMMKKSIVSYEPVDNLHRCSTFATRSLVKKKADPVAFTIPCTIGDFSFAKTLCDLGENINLIPLEIFNQLGLWTSKPTTM